MVVVASTVVGSTVMLAGLEPEAEESALKLTDPASVTVVPGALALGLGFIAQRRNPKQ